MKKIMLSLLLIGIMILSGCGKSNNEITGKGIAISTENGKKVISSTEEMIGGEYIITPAVQEKEIVAGNGNLMTVAVEDGQTRVAVTAIDGTIEKGTPLFKLLADNSVEIKSETVVTEDNYDSLTKKATKSGTKGYRVIAANTLLGDFNNDNTVDIKDFVIFSSNYATTNTTYDIAPASLGTVASWTDIYSQKNSDGKVDIFDLIIFGRNYGKSVVTGITVKGDSTVVAPNSITLTASTTAVWAISDSTVATLNTTSGTTVTLTGIKTGTVQITATSGANSATHTVTVSEIIKPTVTAVTVSGALTVDTGKTTTLTATVKYSDGTVNSEAVEWTTSDATVAKLSAASGVTTEVTGVKAGTATITATKDGKSIIATVTVKPVPEEPGITVYVEKPDSWTGIYMWYDTDLSTEAWDTTLLKADNTTMTDAGTTGWYKRNFPTATKVTFLFNNGTWDSKLDTTGVTTVTKTTNFTVTATTWITKDGKTYDKDPIGPQPAKVSASQASGTFSTDGLEVTLNVSGTGVTSGKYVVNGTDASNGTAYTNGTKITVGKGLTKGQKVTLTLYATDGTTPATATYTYEKTDVVVITEANDIDNLRIYQVMVCSFMDGDPNIGYTWQWAGYRANGDLQGVIDSLDYIKGLGMNAVWMTPIFETYAKGERTQGHNGYFANDYFKIDVNFGTNEKFKELVEKAHNKGLYVILDGVLGHNAGSNIKASPLSGKTPNGSNPVNYQDGGDSLQYYKDVVYYWIKNYKIDGWRFDQSYQLGPGDGGQHKGQGGTNFYWDDIRKEVERACAENKAAGEKWGTLGYQVGEDWDSDAAIVRDTYGNSNEKGLHSAFDFTARYNLCRNLARQEYNTKDWEKDIDDVSLLVPKHHSIYPEWAHPNFFIGNHDVARFGDLINLSTLHNNNYWKRHKAAISYMAAWSGPITLYYGEEWGNKTDNKDIISMHVSRNNGKISGFTSEEEELRQYTSKIMKLRAENSALWQEKTGTMLTAQGTTYIQLKHDSSNGNKVLYCLNTSTNAATFTAAVSGATKLTDGITGEVITGSGNFSIPMEGIQGRIFIVN